MTRRLHEQSAVVVGASSGIGRATALEFARRGAGVTVAARRGDELDRLLAEIEEQGGRALAVPTDVAEPDDVYALAWQAEEHFGRIDTWVNAAAVGVFGRVEDITDEEFERVLRVNVLGHVHGIHAALPALRRAGGGVVIGIASVEAVRPVPLHGPYSASKAALRALYDCLRAELAAERTPIAVTTILPSATDTPFFEHVRSKLDGAMAKAPPPVYAPEVVARAIVRAAVRPTREVPIGGAAAAIMLGQRVSPALMDTAVSLARLQNAALRSGRRDDGVDNVDEPVSGTGRTRGSAGPGLVLEHSPYTRLLGQLPRPLDVLGAVGRRVVGK